VEKARIGESIRTMMADFRPEKYADDRRSRVLELLKGKMVDAVVTAPAAADAEGEGPADLIAALEEIMADMKRQP
jgi:DNA end-binding protein Ku